MIHLLDFVTREVFNWAVEEAEKKKKTDFSKVEFFGYDKGECVQLLPYMMWMCVQLVNILKKSTRMTS